MRVLHLTGTFARGGIATSLWHIIPFLQQSPGIENEIAGLYEIGLFGDRLAEFGVQSHNLGLAGKYDPRGVPRLSALLRSGRFDIVHVQGWPSILYVALASLLNPQVRYIVTEPNITNRRRRWHLKPLERFLYSRFEHIVAVSQAAKNALVTYLPETEPKITVIYNTLDRPTLDAEKRERATARKLLGLDENVPLILSAGGLSYKKGIDVLLHALAHLQQLHPTLNPLTMIAKEGAERPSLEQLAAQLGLQTRVQFIGFRSDLAVYMSAADVLVLSSRWEGCPMVILEAMALGLPIVATDVGGVPELIQDEVSGLLVPSENPKALGEALGRMLINRDRAMQMGCAAQLRSEQFTVQSQAPHFVQLYQADHV